MINEPSRDVIERRESEIREEANRRREKLGKGPTSIKGQAGILEKWRSKIQVMPSGCWEWQGSVSGKAGYGRIGIYGFNFMLHRVIYWMFRGNPGALLVCHHCDNPKCSNPNHLFLGTHMDNYLDMESKGRTARRIGTQDKRHILTDEIVSMIRTMPFYRGCFTKLARELGVDQTTVWGAAIGKSWKHVKTPPRIPNFEKSKSRETLNSF